MVRIICTIFKCANDFFKLCPSTVTHDHVYKLYKPSSTSSARSRFFACRIINALNNLPLSTDFSSVNAFKRSISKTDFFGIFEI